MIIMLILRAVFKELLGTNKNNGTIFLKYE